MEDNIFTIIIRGMREKIVLNENGDITIKELITNYLNKIQKANLLVNNIDNVYFVYNAKRIEISDYEKKINEFFFYKYNEIVAYNNYNAKFDIEIIEKIKENLFTSVYKARSLENSDIVAVKKIDKDKIKNEMKYTLCKEEITEEDFKPEIEKFNKEIKNMEQCYCENSVKIFDYFDTPKEFIIIMELCDDNLLHILADRNEGFNAKEIKKILSELNNIFKIMNEKKISHRDIKLNNILIKYLNKEKTEYKVLLSDYGISNQLCSLTQKFITHAGSQLIMAPEILNDEKYDNKCDLWSLGVIIYQLNTKKYPYFAPSENLILRQIKEKGQTVLREIKDDTLKDLLSKLLVENPKDRITWEEYFKHPFFT